MGVHSGEKTDRMLTYFMAFLMSNLAVISDNNFVDSYFRIEGMLFALSCLCSDWKVSGDTSSSTARGLARTILSKKAEAPISPSDPQHQPQKLQLSQSPSFSSRLPCLGDLPPRRAPKGWTSTGWSEGHSSWSAWLCTQEERLHWRWAQLWQHALPCQRHLCHISTGHRESRMVRAV